MSVTMLDNAMQQLKFPDFLLRRGFEPGDVKKGTKEKTEIASLDHCAWLDTEHEDGGSFIVMHADRATFRLDCHHSSCKGKLSSRASWQFLEAIVPFDDEDFEVWSGKREFLSSEAGIAFEGFTRILTGDELGELDIRLDFLVSQILVRGQPAIIGGPTKCCKTNLLMDMMLSIATGTPFLGKFETTQAPTMICSFETGDARSKLVYSAIRDSKGLKGKVDQFFYSTDMPKVCDRRWLDELESVIRERDLEVLAIDPLYIAVGQSMAEVSGATGFGDLLQPLTEIGNDTNCTIVLAHHVTKTASRKNDPLDIVDLSGSGISEFMRQWVLLSRRTPYVPGTGHHELHLNAGGSAGHGILQGVDLNEGDSAEQAMLEGIRWECTVLDADEAVKQDMDRQRQKRRSVEEQDHEKQCDLLWKHMLELNRPTTINALKHGSDGVEVFKADKPKITSYINTLLKEGRVVYDSPPEGAHPRGKYYLAIIPPDWKP